MEIYTDLLTLCQCVKNPIIKIKNPSRFKNRTSVRSKTLYIKAKLLCYPKCLFYICYMMALGGYSYD